VKLAHALSFSLSIMVGASLATGEQVKSGPQEGDPLGAFLVTKCAGAEDDGVEVGQNLCYRCRNGVRPQVVVFIRSMDSKVMELLKQLDTAVTRHEDEKLRAFVNVLGEDQDELEETAKQAAAKSGTKNVPFVVPNEFENGPDNYGINPKAEVTVLLASGLGVKANYAVAKASDLDVNAIVKDISKILN